MDYMGRVIKYTNYTNISITSSDEISETHSKSCKLLFRYTLFSFVINAPRTHIIRYMMSYLHFLNIDHIISMKLCLITKKYVIVLH